MEDIAMDMGGVDVDVDIDIDHDHHDEQPGIDDILHSLGHSRATVSAVSAGSAIPGQDDNLAHPDAADVDTAGSTLPGEHDASLPATGPSAEDTDPHAAADVQEIAGWSVPQLHAEIMRLRREVRRLNPAWFLSTLGVGEADTAAALGAALGASLEHNLGDGEMSRSSGSVLGVARDASGDHRDDGVDGVAEVPGVRGGSEAVKKKKGGAAKRGGGGVGGRKKRKREEKEVVLDTETGKRVEKARRTELGKAVRAKMRDVMGIREADPLPTYSPLEVTYDVPNWSAGLDSMGQAWVERIAVEVLADATAGTWPKIPQEDIELDIIRSTARTAFQNFAKRLQAENDPVQMEKKERYAKSRRRWARKDLKQKRRSKAVLDPSLADTVIPPSALHLDYMSSEYSSAGEDSDADGDVADNGEAAGNPGVGSGAGRQAKVDLRRRQWVEVLALRAGEVREDGDAGKGWAEGLGEKVLEVRTPRWRSDELNTLYARLDAITTAASQARSNPLHPKDSKGSPGLSHSHVDSGGTASGTQFHTQGNTTRAGHVAPSHNRFKMPGGMVRRGRRPREGGEAWMWRSGVVGVWPGEGGAGVGGSGDGMGGRELGEVDSGGQGGLRGEGGEGYRNGPSGLARPDDGAAGVSEDRGVGVGGIAPAPATGTGTASGDDRTDTAVPNLLASDDDAHVDAHSHADVDPDLAWREEAMGLVDALHELEGREGV
ncbi:hypothetical protein JCM24511_08215 [Saitozyma sp. JCM 24511]|nr:hypothetical protein JCM24511_08215 [Saitozyma sp. JCM 24511]